MIIDVHSHIGNILYPGGGELIFRRGIAFPASPAPLRYSEESLFRDNAAARLISVLFPILSVAGERRRNFAATLENFQASLEGTDIAYSVCAPVAPHNTFEDMLSARDADPRVIPFTSPDFTGDTVPLLLKDIPRAAGVKIHPILQQVEADSKRVMEAVDAVSGYSKPVLLHCGRAYYYTVGERRRRFSGFASTDRMECLVAAFPGVKFIVGHAGLGEVRQVMDSLAKYQNVYVDTSFQPPEIIRSLVSVFGGDRVLFASDWPYGLRLPAIRAAEEACGGDAGLKKVLFYENAAALLGITN